MSDTPETDEQINGKPCTRFAIYGGDSLRDALVPSEFARKLERERDEAREDANYAEKESSRMRSALQRLADCDWVITPHDRMDAVRKIARDALEAANPTNKHEQVSSKLARYKKDAEVVTDKQEVFRRLVEAIVTTDMTADTLLEIRRLFGDEIDAAVACLRRTDK